MPVIVYVDELLIFFVLQAAALPAFFIELIKSMKTLIDTPKLPKSPHSLTDTRSPQRRPPG